MLVKVATGVAAVRYNPIKLKQFPYSCGRLNTKLGPSHYLNQCWNIVNWTLRIKLQWNCNRNWSIFIQEKAFENVIWNMSVILSRPQRVKMRYFTYLTEVRKRIFASWLRVIITSCNGLLQIWYRGIIQNSADLLIGISGTCYGVAWIKIQNRSWKCVRERRINNSEIAALLFRPLISGIRQHESFLRIGFSKSIQMSISSSLITWN